MGALEDQRHGKRKRKRDGVRRRRNREEGLGQLGGEEEAVASRLPQQQKRVFWGSPFSDVWKRRQLVLL